jgi:hypothetical protein
VGKDKGSSGETEANHISSRQKKNRGGAKGEVGEAEEGLACVSLCRKTIQSALNRNLLFGPKNEQPILLPSLFVSM